MKKNGGDFCKEVLDDFATYKVIMNEQKRILDETIHINANKKTRTDWLAARSKIEHSSVEGIFFEVEVLPDNHRHFKFLIMAEGYSNKRLARYDSAGSPHRNPANSPHYSKQRIAPPHFHKWDDLGRNIAYKTEKLNSVKEEDLGNINRIIILFCEEMKAYCQHLSWPIFKINEKPGSQLPMFEEEENDDPLKNIKFK
ncbi:hypothetical protein [Siphonobacter sp. SORGH_AS_0500]|uniref:hypothetical protein n=1 Tax=Siphonobacter sp. SORGH_AS_0500 TaxID=1864824 RepID=UPI00285AE9E1|nr:hypothetical protein [Siphonobacter sp. SORGH_AS_0500]MDR6194905.1 hypothetical protein [Siphonobacter sp. SORGH_AS_0500]